MGEFDYRVERQRVLLEAEEWAKGISSVQYHGLTSMWYETKESKEDIEKNIEFIYEISETDSGEVVLWKP